MMSAGQINTGVHGQAFGLSDDGLYFTFSNGARDVPAWHTYSPNPDPDRDADAMVAIPGGSREAIAISRDGRIAVADAGTIYVASLDSPSEVIELAGSDEIDERGLQFLGDGDRLLSYSGSALALWDLDQYSRIGVKRSTTIPFACSACGGPHLAARHDGAVVAALADSSSRELSITGLESSTAPTIVLGGWFGTPLWSPDGSRLLVTSQDSIEIRDPGQPDAPGVDRITSERAGETLAMGFRSGTELVTLDPEARSPSATWPAEWFATPRPCPRDPTYSRRSSAAAASSP